MSFNETAYDTTACRGTQLQKYETGLKKALINNDLMFLDVNIPGHDRFTIYAVAGGNSVVDQLHSFTHPVLMANSEDNQGAKSVFVDVRMFGSWNNNEGRFQARNKVEYSWTIKRAILNKLWSDGYVDLFKDISILPAQVYASLISESISRRFSLDPNEQAIIAVLACNFYYSLFSDNEPNELEQVRVITAIAKATKISAEEVSKIVDGCGQMTDLESLINIIHEKIDNVALQSLNVATLYGVIVNTWFGTNSKEIISTALEHPPTWILIVESSLASLTFKRSTLNKISSRFDRGGLGKSFSQAFDALVGPSTAVSVASSISIVSDEYYKLGY